MLIEAMKLQLESSIEHDNLQARPPGKNGPAPIQLWETRTPVAEAERLAFLRRLQTARTAETQKLIAPRPGSRPAADVELGAKDRATVARHAARRVLLELGYLFCQENRELVQFGFPCFVRNLGRQHNGRQREIAWIISV